MQKQKPPAKVAEWSQYSASALPLPSSPHTRAGLALQLHRFFPAGTRTQQPGREHPPAHRAEAARHAAHSTWGVGPNELIYSRNRSMGFSPQKPQPTLVWLLNRKHQSMEAWNTVIVIHPYKFGAELAKCAWRTSASQPNHVGSMHGESSPLPWIPCRDNIFYRRKWDVLYIINDI